MTKIQKLKQELKLNAIEIRKLKSTRKSVPDGFVKGLNYLRSVARYKHIAYCMLRGKTYEQIEISCREDNKPNMAHVEKIMEDYREDVCVSA